MIRGRQVVIFVIAALAMLALQACTRHVSVADILNDPGKFTGKEVTISGKASGSFGGFGNGFFQVDDGSGRIMVVSGNYGLPAEGAQVSVTGEVQQGISFGGRNFGVMLRQTRARD